MSLKTTGTIGMPNETDPIKRVRKRQELAAKYLRGEITLDEYHEQRESYSIPYSEALEEMINTANRCEGEKQ